MSEDMHSLLGLFFSGQATEEEADTVRKWVDASEENKAEFDYVEKLWSRSGDHPPVAFDTGKAWKNIDSKIKTPASKAKRVPMYARLITAAAGILLLALLLPRLINSRNDSRTEIADTDVKTIQLEDGSKVYLRKGSTLQYPAVFAGDTRRVTLTGEAFFEVAPDATKPFIIKAAGTEVQVVGTSFSVNTANDKVELIVKTGRVNFSPAGDAAKKILVVAGERAVYANSSMTKLANADNNFNAWQSKQLVFTSTPLDQVAAVLSNYYNVTIRLRKEDAGQMAATTVTATFDNQPLSSVLDELSLITTNHIQKISETDYEISLK